MTNTDAKKEHKSGVLGILIRLVLVVVIIGSGVVIAKKLISTAPQADKKTPPIKSIPVITKKMIRENSFINISAMGTVIAAEEVVIKPRISGDIVSLNPRFKEGALLKEKSQLVEIDSQDYQLLVKDRENLLIQAEANLKIEMGRQSVALHEMESLNRDINDSSYDLALRKPQLKQHLASLELAKNNLEKAKLELSRTKIKMPFNGVVLEKNVALGSQVSSQTPIARVVKTDEFWIKALVHVNDLQQFNIPSNDNIEGALVTITYGRNNKCTGKVVKLLRDVDARGRMAKVLISVKKPLELKSPLLLGQYVKVDISGHGLQNIIKIPRSVVHNNKQIWIYNNDETLEVFRITPMWIDRDFAYIKNNNLAGRKLIISDLSVTVTGMKVIERSKKNKTKLGVK